MAYKRPIPLGQALLTYGGSEMQVQAKSVVIHRTEDLKDRQIGKYGTSTAGKVLSGKHVWVECYIDFTGLETLELIERQAKEGNAVGIGLQDLGKDLYDSAKELIIHPIGLATTEADATLWKASLEVEEGLTYDIENVDTGVKVRFECFPDDTKDIKQAFGVWGDVGV